MGKLTDKLRKFWYFRIANPVIRKGEAGGFRWCFRRYWLDIETLSGNFKVRFIADQHPYGYLISDNTGKNVHGFAFTLYEIGKLMTTDQKFVNDIQKAINNYSKRLESQANVEEDETEDRIALEEMKSLQEHIELPKKERRKVVRDINGRFAKAVKNAKNESKTGEKAE